MGAGCSSLCQPVGGGHLDRAAARPIISPTAAWRGPSSEPPKEGSPAVQSSAVKRTMDVARKFFKPGRKDKQARHLGGRRVSRQVSRTFLDYSPEVLVRMNSVSLRQHLQNTSRAILAVAFKQLLSFTPRHIARRLLAAGRDQFEEHPGAVRLALPIVEMEAAVLLLDVSGFCALAEKYAQQGPSGCEALSAVISRLFNNMLTIIDHYEGDVECFAGDALLVTFTSTVSGPIGLGDSCRRAANCASLVHTDLDGFRPDLSGALQLFVHSAIASGKVKTVEIAGQAVARSESVLAGAPLLELSKAINMSSKQELILAESVWDHVASVFEGRFDVTEKEGGCRCVSFKSTSTPTLPPPPVLRPGQSRRTIGATEWADQVTAKFKKQFGSAKHSVSEHTTTVSASSASLGTVSVSNNVAVPPPLSNVAIKADSMEISSLAKVLRFMPTCVWQRFITGQRELMAELRDVSVVFMAHHQPKDLHMAARLENLRMLLGDCIDVVEGRFGGVTRQIAIDDKGLVAIFCFGLPGFTHENHPLHATRAAITLVGIMAEGGEPCTAGVTTGNCYCGLIGDVTRRAEYSVVGDTVNTAARLAFIAHKDNEKILLANAVVSKIRSGDRSVISFRPNREVTMKGKTTPETTWVPHMASYGSRISGSVTAFRASDASVEPGAESSTARRSAPSDINPSHMLSAMSNMSLGDDPALAPTLPKQLKEGCTDLVAHLGSPPESARPQIAMVEGPLGVGKSDLVAAVVGEVTGGRVSLSAMSGLNMIRFCSSSEDQATPFLAAHELLASLVQLDDGMGEKFSITELFDYPDHAVSEIPKMIPPWLKDLSAASNLPPLDAAARLEQIYIGIISTALVASPTLVVVEAIQWMDSNSWRILVNLVIKDPPAPTMTSKTIAMTLNPGKSLRGLRLRGEQPQQQASQASSCILVSSRPAEDHPWARRAEFKSLVAETRVYQYKLKPLGDKDVVRIAMDIFECGSLSPELEQLVTGRSEGIGLFAKELCCWLNSQGFIYQNADGVCDLNGAAASDSDFCPPTLQRIIQGNLEKLSSSLSLVVRCASVLGHRFTSEQLLPLLPHTQKFKSAYILKAIRKLKRLHIIRDVGNGTQWEFCNMLYSSVAYDMLPMEMRRELHGRAARALQEKLDSQDAREENLPFSKIIIQLAHHWMTALGANDTTNPSVAHFETEDLQAAAMAVRKVVMGLVGRMDFLRAWELRVPLLNITEQIPPDDGGAEADAEAVYMMIQVGSELEGQPDCPPDLDERLQFLKLRMQTLSAYTAINQAARSIRCSSLRKTLTFKYDDVMLQVQADEEAVLEWPLESQASPKLLVSGDEATGAAAASRRVSDMTDHSSVLVL